jgi:hypothetical protein
MHQTICSALFQLSMARGTWGVTGMSGVAGRINSPLKGKPGLMNID